MKRTTTLMAFFFTLWGCIAPQQAQTTQSKQTFTFDFTPKESAKAGSAGMVLALVKPYYAKAFTTGSGELFKRFQNALGDDIQELIIAKGFTLKGPYEALDEMIFEDKKRTEILIQIEINPEFTAAEGGWRKTSSLLGSAFDTYTYSGTVSLIGKINLSGIEPLTNEKIWSKSVSIPNVENIHIETSSKPNHMLTPTELLNDASVYNALGKALQTQYGGIMDKVAAHFSIEEFTSLKKGVAELKAKKGF